MFEELDLWIAETVGHIFGADAKKTLTCNVPSENCSIGACPSNACTSACSNTGDGSGCATAGNQGCN